MKNWIKIIPVMLVLLLTFQLDADAQYYGKKKKKKKKKPVKTEQVESNSTIPTRSKSSRATEFTDRLWYGGGFNLGFSGNDILSVFNLGISPMVGYKIIEPVSVGPRIGINYTYIKGIGSDNLVKKIQPLSFEYGLFARFKFLPILFAHVEYTRQNEEVPGFFGNLIAVDSQTGDAITVRNKTNDFNIGLGYTSDGDISYEIMLLYDAIQDDALGPFDISLPIAIRVGFNYRF